MRVCKPNLLGKEGLGLDQQTHFYRCGDWDLNQEVKLGKSSLAISQRTKSHLRRYKWMHGETPGLKQPVHIRIEGSQTVDPNGGVSQDHGYSKRLFGMSSSPGMVPPKAARRLDASKWICAWKALRMSAVLSVIPVNSEAVFIRSSSITTVVRIGFPSSASVVSPKEDESDDRPSLQP